MLEVSFSAPTPLDATHDVTGFDCGSPPLNDFLKRHALSNQAGGSAKTFVTTSDGLQVVGYYSLTATAYLHEEVPERAKKGQPKHPIPAILMARLAVHMSMHGKGLGAHLFRDALLRSLNVTDHIGARVFVVDAKDEAAVRFYRKFEMMPAPGNDKRLFLLFKDIKKLIAG